MTLYATLGQEAIIHGINETDVTHVITSMDLLSKFDVSIYCETERERLVCRVRLKENEEEWKGEVCSSVINVRT